MPVRASGWQLIFLRFSKPPHTADGPVVRERVHVDTGWMVSMVILRHVSRGGHMSLTYRVLSDTCRLPDTCQLRLSDGVGSLSDDAGGWTAGPGAAKWEEGHLDRYAAFPTDFQGVPVQGATSNLISTPRYATKRISRS